MWTRNPPKKEGYYWVKAAGQLTGKEYIHPVHVYEGVKGSGEWRIFSDGENFGEKCGLFKEWWNEEIPMPQR